MDIVNRCNDAFTVELHRLHPVLKVPNFLRRTQPTDNKQMKSHVFTPNEHRSTEKKDRSNLDGGVERASGGEPLVGLPREPGDRGGERSNLDLDSLLVNEALLYAVVHRLHQKVRNPRRFPHRLLLRLLCQRSSLSFQ